MNRRQFLQSIIAVPAVIAIPSLLVEEVPEFLDLKIDITEFGNRLPNLWFYVSGRKYPAYFSNVEIKEYIHPYKTVHSYTYIAEVKVLNSVKIKQSQVKLQELHFDNLYITV